MVFKKHAAHKHMVTNWKNPRLILIQGRLGEAPISGLSSFNSMDQVLKFKWFSLYYSVPEKYTRMSSDILLSDHRKMILRIML